MLTAKEGEQYKWRRVCTVDVSTAGAVSEVELPWVSYIPCSEKVSVCVCERERKSIYLSLHICMCISICECRGSEHVSVFIYILTEANLSCVIEQHEMYRVCSQCVYVCLHGKERLCVGLGLDTGRVKHPGSPLGPNHFLLLPGGLRHRCPPY